MNRKGVRCGRPGAQSSSAPIPNQPIPIPMPDYALMNQCIYEGKAKEVEQMTQAALAEGKTAQEILQDGLIAGMSVVGEDFKHNILYVPEVLIAARAMKPGVAVIKTLRSAQGS